MAPISRSMRAMASTAASLEVTSKATACTLAPSSRSVAAAHSSLRSSRPLRTTVAPALARPRASAWPMPPLEPVMSAVRPARLKLSRTDFKLCSLY